MNSDVSIKVENVGKVYPLYEKPVDRLKEAMLFSKRNYHTEYHALNAVSFEVKKGETFGIIGTNGAGKSTLLKLITGVAKPTTGQIEVRGKVSALLELGAGFNMEYTGIQNIYLNGTMMGYKKEEMEPKVKQVMEFADIGEFIYQPVKTYSSGMFARLAFAVAINVEPDILIVDEALSVGDVFFQNKCYKKFEELRLKGATVIFVSHDISSVKQMCSRALWLEKGQPQMLGESVEVCNAYTNSILQKGGVGSVSETAIYEKEEYQINSFELVDYPPVSYTNESILHPQVQILSAYCKDEKGELVQEVYVNRKYKIGLVFKTEQDIDQCIAGFVLETIKGNWIINCNSAICGNKATFSVEAGTAVKVEFEIMLPPLIKGEYVVGVAVSSGEIANFEVLTWLYNVLCLKVINRGNNSALLDVNSNVEVFTTRGIKNE